ncbi:uncharacterized protein F5891DRAFT_1195685 [Suillus fuscotomentosus]|uniref:Ubiquitin-like protease family profile domain-containing protein n=1 Tax=Suillus fuscotomentosus TaxID=1912939 RepID=A0AAD4DU57_9AGAM|nr:uncharacterized protein F5891DRAFT_1195685 [Suillus fuscotomentosus]KAG1893991.1 hypothetical protein F5891DRAFT_1195685 [Suillus fuscotomentosus]
MFEHVPWDVELKGFDAHTSLRTSELLPLLADSMVNGRLLDALVAVINDHVDEHNGTVVETLDFANVLLLDLLHDGTIQHVIFPINVANVHWAIISMDASTQMILYGDSLEWSMPSSYVDAMRHWLKNHGFAPFGKGSLSHGEQTDSFSCAITALNTIKHAVFRHSLFTNDSKYQLYMEVFLMLAKSHFESEQLSESSDGSFADDASDFSVEFSSCPPSYPSPVPASPELPASCPSPPPPTSTSSERVTLNLRVCEEDKSVGLFKYFPTTTCEEHLQAVWVSFSWELENCEQDAHRVRVEAVERDIHRREGNRERKQNQHAREKAMKKATTNDPSDIAPSLPMMDLAEVSCPYRKI